MFVRKKIDYYPITVILLVLGVDLGVFLFSHSLTIPIIWAIASLFIKGLICSWNHHHQHYKFFSHAWANRLIELIMGLHTGIIGEAWVLHHTLGHHLNYLDQTKDESAWKTPSGRVMSYFEYTFRVGILAYPLALEVGKRHPKSRNRLIQNFLMTVAVLGLLAWVNWAYTLIIFVIPMIILFFVTISATYNHHSGLDTENPYEATYNITDNVYNFLTCNLGYHTAHHVQCGKHWSELPQFHAEIQDKIPAHLYRDAGFPFSVITKIGQSFGRQPRKMANS